MDAGPEGHVRNYQVAGIRIDALSPDRAARLVVEAALAATSLQVHLCNAFTLSLVDTDPLLRHALVHSDHNFPDGTPVAWMGRRAGARGPVRGPGLVGDVARIGVDVGLRHYLFGGVAGVAEDMRAGLERHAPGIIVVGTEMPPFTDLTDRDVARLCDRIRASRAQVLWVGLGTPRQDYLVPRLAAHLELPVIPVGAAFDFWSGNVREAPRALQGSGFEWVYRLAREPRRLWRRYLLGNPRFIRTLLRHWQDAWL